MQPPDITRVFKGARNEFEVEIVFAQNTNQSPKEAHTYDEIIVVMNGVIKLDRSDREGIEILFKVRLYLFAKEYRAPDYC